MFTTISIKSIKYVNSISAINQRIVTKLYAYILFTLLLLIISGNLGANNTKTKVTTSRLESNKNYEADILKIFSQAAKKDPQILAAFAEYEAVKQNKPIAFSDLLPELILSAGISYDKILNFGDDPSVTTKFFAIDASQTLFAWDRIQRYLQADLEVQQAIHNLEIAKEDLLIRVVDAYFNILEAEDILEFVQTEKDAVDQLYKEAKERFDVGIIAIADVEEAKARYEIQTAEEIEARNTVEDRYEELAEIIGESAPKVAILTPTFKPSSPKPTSIDKWVKIALERNHTYKSQQLEHKIRHKDEDIAFAGHLPNGQISAGYRGRQSSRSLQIDQISTAKGYITSYGGSVEGNWELFAGGGTQATINQASHNAMAAWHEEQRVKREVISNTRQAYRNIISTMSQVSALEQAEISSLSSLEATKAGYDVGTRASIDVLDRLTELYDNKQRLASARYDYIKNVINLKRTSGVLTSQDMNIVNKWLVARKNRETSANKSNVKSKILKDIEQKDNAEFKKELSNKNPSAKTTPDKTEKIKTKSVADEKKPEDKTPVEKTEDLKPTIRKNNIDTKSNLKSNTKSETTSNSNKDKSLDELEQQLKKIIEQYKKQQL